MMILRSLRLRHGRLALPRSTTPSLLRHRTLTATPSLHQDPVPLPQHHRPPPHEVRDPSDPVAQDFLFFHHQKARTGHLGSDLAPHYQPHTLLSNPPRPEDVTLELLMASQTHIGHATSLWHPGNAKYIFGVRGREDPVHIISLDTTAAYLRRAAKVMRGVASRGGLILFVGTRAGQARIIVRAAQLAGGCHLFNKWTPGSITNGQQILGRCRKRVVDEHDDEVLGFQDQLDLKSSLKPDLVICLNPLENYILLHECGIHNIPTIGIVDTDVNPTWVTYPIPANDDSLRSVQVICGVLGRAGEDGQKERMKQARMGRVSSMPCHGFEPPTEGQAEKEAEAKQREMLALQAQEAYEEDGELVMEDLSLPEGREGEDIEVDGEIALQDFDGGEGVEDRLYGGRGEGGEEEGEMGDLVAGGFSSQGEQQLAEGDEEYARDRPLSAAEMAQAPAEQELPDFVEDEKPIR